MIRGRDVVTLDTFRPEEIRHVVALARTMKARGHGRPLEGAALAMVFFQPSLRTRASFSLAFSTLGGSVVDMAAGRDLWHLELRDKAVMRGEADEHVRDAAAVLSRYCDAIAIRALGTQDDWALARRDEVIVSFQKHATVPIFNMESVLDHPTQAWGDALTLEEELGDLRGRRLALTWCHSPKARSLAVPHGVMQMATKLGMHVTLCHPEGYELDGLLRETARRNAQASGGSLREAHALAEGLAGADVVYAASWGATHLYGRPQEEQALRQQHAGWRLTRQAMAASRDARFLHAMPVRRNVEVDDDVVDGPRSLMLAQAENRLHIQRALFTAVLAPPDGHGAGPG
ncbi:MAG: N-acetylornithine carbamoyltransferase [Planctomycetia bacterium]